MKNCIFSALTFCLVTLSQNITRKVNQLKWLGAKKKKKKTWGFLFSSATYPPISFQPLRFFILSFLNSPLSIFLFPAYIFDSSLPSNLASFLIHPSFSLLIHLSESLMPAMSWSVWMWDEFRMIIPSNYVHLISHLLLYTGTKLLTSDSLSSDIF